jgi:hypothetical protein
MPVNSPKILSISLGSGPVSSSAGVVGTGPVTLRAPPEYVLSRFVAAFGNEGKFALERVLERVD